ncbi:Chloride Channel (ClC) Family [Phytophthora infestans T30-4]|uniref:Chloride Channel (ClC) Family n=2 Tax=Phytophthora infestans TaxID=4787 RepID=D0NHC6_PHYIT|nr:Chloride Channel (ClC) Family [Phytophthora infestans T30-4]EEY58765.1 Chloride Channel (ClC) Family [Phytophthora infestans T30-4]|eukprot:XP_002901709.1 Chloride Channel (ClC) Family [Phytophthora infestans T30-4]
MVLGSIAGVYGLLFDDWVRSFLRFRRFLIEQVGPFSYGAFGIWVLWCVAFGAFSTCCGHFITPMSDGSGIPTMRGLFAGVFQNPDDLLSFRTLVAKTFGTLISSSSGLSVGRGGPFTQIMAMIGYLISKIPLFRRANFGQANYNFIRAAVAAGVTSGFGSPVGAVLFSIEATAKHYEIKCLWEGIICSSFALLVFRIAPVLKSELLFEKTNFTGFELDVEMFAFVFLGALSGLAAGLYCKLMVGLRFIQLTVFTKLGLTKPSLKRRLIHVVSICLITATITFSLGILRISDRLMVNELFRDQSLSFPQWGHISDFPQTALMVYIMMKFTITLLPCGAPISCGVFGPIFTTGAAIGRLYGEILSRYWTPAQSPATYAVVGAAGFAGSVTQTVSTAVIVFELTGQLSHMLPVMISCIVAYFVSSMITPSFYDIVAEWAGMTSVCYDVNEYILGRKLAKDHMGPVPVVFTRETTYDEAIQALSTHKHEGYFPLCDSEDNRLLLGCIRRYDLEVGIARFIAVNRPRMTKTKNRKVSKQIEHLVSKVLDIDKRKVMAVEDLSLLNSEEKNASSTANMLELGPPFSPFEFTSIPVQSYIPQVGEEVNLHIVHKVASMSNWTQVYVVSLGRLLGVIQLDASLLLLRRESSLVRPT